MEKGIKEYFENEEKYTFESYTSENLNNIKSFSYGNLVKNINGNLCLIPLCCFGDYDDSTAIERSNHRVFWKQFSEVEGIYKVYGDYSSKGVVIDIDILNDNKDILMILQGLVDYPVIDEFDLGIMELEMVQEAFKYTYERDFRDAINKYMITETRNEDYELPDNVDIWNIYRMLEDKANVQPLFEKGGNVYIDVKKLMKGFDKNMINDSMMED